MKVVPVFCVTTYGGCDGVVDVEGGSCAGCAGVW